MSQQKVVALLELTGEFTGGNNFVTSFNYYWTLYPNFITFEIVDNRDDIIYLNQLLEEYYQKGYRIFFGPVSSTNTQSIISWFTNHPDATCIVPLASAQFILPKNIFRLIPSDYYFIEYIKQVNSSTTRVFYFYSPNQLSPNDLLTKLQEDFTTVFAYPVISTSQLTSELVEQFFNDNGVTPNDIVIIYLLYNIDRETYFNLFKTIDIGDVKQYEYCPLGFPNISNNITNLYNNYFCIFLSSVNTTSIYTDAINTLGISYAGNSLTSVYLLTLLANNENIDNAYYYGEFVTWFDDNNGIKYWSYGIYLYTETGFKKTNIYLNDRKYGLITFNKKV